MTHTYQISGMTCSGCASTVEKALSTVAGVEFVKVDLAQSIATITMHHHIPTRELQTALKAHPSYQLHELNHLHSKQDFQKHVHMHNSSSSDDGSQYYCPMLCEGDKKYLKRGN